MNVNVLFYVVMTVLQPDNRNESINKYVVESNLGEIGTLYTQAKYKTCDTVWINKPSK